MTGCSLVTTAVGSEAAAAEMADALISERLAACVQVVGPVRSTYRWEGAVTHAVEWLCMAKTAEHRQRLLIDRIRTLHSYQVPDIISVPIADGDAGYLDWIRHETAPGPATAPGEIKE